MTEYRLLLLPTCPSSITKKITIDLVLSDSFVKKQLYKLEKNHSSPYIPIYIIFQQFSAFWTVKIQFPLRLTWRQPFWKNNAHARKVGARRKVCESPFRPKFPCVKSQVDTGNSVPTWNVKFRYITVKKAGITDKKIHYPSVCRRLSKCSELNVCNLTLVVRSGCLQTHPHAHAHAHAGGTTIALRDIRPGELITTVSFFFAQNRPNKSQIVGFTLAKCNLPSDVSFVQMWPTLYNVPFCRFLSKCNLPRASLFVSFAELSMLLASVTRDLASTYLERACWFRLLSYQCCWHQ